jgi:hypothetical protein
VNIAELEQAITRCRERGDQTQLQDLQARYRASVGVVRITREPIHLIERQSAVAARQPNMNVKENAMHETRAATLPAGMNVMPPGIRGCTINNKAGYEGGAACHSHDGDESSMKNAMTLALKDAGRRSSLLPETIWLARDVLDAINDFPPTGIEHGAWLFGRRSHGFPDVVEVLAVDGWTRGDEERVVMNRDIQLERSYARDGLKLLGNLHTHPYWSDRSDGDKEGWTELAGVLGRSVVGLIVTGKYRVAGEYFSFDEPRFQAWIASGVGIRQVSVTKERNSESWPPRVRSLLPLIAEEH